jgi:phage terminase large subunit-like protein
MSGTSSDYPHVDAAMRYARGVAAGIIPACKWVQLACNRHLADLEKCIVMGEWEYRFDSARANRVCKFISLLPHTKGKWATARTGKNRIQLEPWQCFILCVLFGWVHVETGYRRFRACYICVPRKNGKSILSAGIGLYMLAMDGEHGAEVYSGATSEKQAWEVFRPARLMAQKTPKYLERYGVEVNAQTLCLPGDMSRFEPVIGKPGDGASPSCAIIDEYHEHKTDELVDTMVTGMGAREQPLLLIITTAGSNTGGPCYAMQLDVQKTLDGVIDNETLFGVIYGIDEADDWTTEDALRKANPNFDISVSREFLLQQQREAVQSSRKQNIFKTKHLNLWVGAREAFFNLEAWNRLADSELNPAQFEGEDAWLGMDLASKIDIASTVRLFKRVESGQEHYYAFARHYVPEDTVSDPERKQYAGWAYDGHMTLTEGSMIDQDAIKADVLDDAGRHAIQGCGFDAYGGTKLSAELMADGVPMVEVPMTTRHLSEPMKWLEALILSGRIHHSGDPVLTWMVSNVVAKTDANDNVFPRKEAPENKIDGAVALIIALGRAMGQAEAAGSAYDERGIIYL